MSQNQVIITTPEAEYIRTHFEELVDRYAGKYIAVVKDAIAGVGSTPIEAEANAKTKFPGAHPSLLKVPRPSDFISVLVAL